MAAITVCVPVWNGEAFVAETLDSVAAQDFGDFKVLISLDRSDDGSEAVCRRYLADPRFTLVVHDERRGWIGNLNWLIENVDTEYFCIMPHDDVLEPNYLSALHAVASSDRGIKAVCTDMKGFGSSDAVMSQREATGPAFDRAIEVLLNHLRTVVLRGLIRTEPGTRRPLLPDFERDHNLAIETVWTLQLALRGAIRRVPEVLYHKRYHMASAHAEWFKYTPGELLTMFADEAVKVTQIALAAFPEPAQQEIILAAGQLRALGIGRARPFAWPENDWERAASLAIYRDQMRGFDFNWRMDEVVARPEAQPLRDALVYAAKARKAPSQLRYWARRLLRPRGRS